MGRGLAQPGAADCSNFKTPKGPSVNLGLKPLSANRTFVSVLIKKEANNVASRRSKDRRLRRICHKFHESIDRSSSGAISLHGHKVHES